MKTLSETEGLSRIADLLRYISEIQDVLARTLVESHNYDAAAAKAIEVLEVRNRKLQAVIRKNEELRLYLIQICTEAGNAG